MSEWLSYTLTDLMMFSADSYFRLFELQNRAVWPAQIAVLLASVAAMAIAVRDGPLAGRLISAILAGFWLTCAWSFHLERYAPINLAAPVFAAGFAVQALLLGWMGVARGRIVVAGSSLRRLLALSVLLVALAGWPLLAPISGRPWLQAELVGLAPDPTAAATFALVLLDARRSTWALLAVPIAWTSVSTATLWTMGAHQAFVLPTFAVLTVAARVGLRAASGEAKGRR